MHAVVPKKLGAGVRPLLRLEVLCAWAGGYDDVWSLRQLMCALVCERARVCLCWICEFEKVICMILHILIALALNMVLPMFDSDCTTCCTAKKSSRSYLNSAIKTWKSISTRATEKSIPTPSSLSCSRYNCVDCWLYKIILTFLCCWYCAIVFEKHVNKNLFEAQPCNAQMSW